MKGMCLTGPPRTASPGECCLRPSVRTLRRRPGSQPGGHAANPWKQRVAAVSFVKLAAPALGHKATILDIASVLSGVNHRFVQLGCGWMLRELSVHDLGAVTGHLRAHARTISKEGMRYSIEKMPSKAQREMLDHHASNGPPKGWATAVGREAGPSNAMPALTDVGAGGSGASSAGAAAEEALPHASSRKRKR